MKLKKFRTKHKLLSLTIIFIIAILGVEIYSYVRISKTIKDKAINYAENSMIQLDENINVVIQSVKKMGFNIAYDKYVQKYLNAENLAERTLYMEFVTNLINKVSQFNEDIVDIGLIDNDQNINSFLQEVSYNTYESLHKKYNFTEKGFTKPVFVTFFEDGHLRRQARYAYIIPVFWTVDTTELSKKIGSVVIILKTQSIEKFISNMSVKGDEIFCLKDENGNHIFSNSDKENLVEQSYDNKKYIIINRKNKDTNWNIYTIISVKSVTQDISFLRNIVVYIGLMMISMLIGFNIIIGRNITFPMEYIIKSINEIGDKNIKQRINGSVKGDFGIISRNINKMLDKIENMTKKIFNSQKQLYEMELNNKQIKLSALQSQINPHFLYNTLECIRSIATVYKSNEISVISTSMARLFRYSIKAPDMVTVKDEMEIIKDYLKIIDIRFCGKIKYEFKIDSEIKEYKIPKMILQPIVENAVYHGVGQKLDNGFLSIKGIIKENKIIFIVKDDGVGMDKKILENINESFNNKNISKNCLGLYNINQRIKLMLGKVYDFNIKSEKNVGTEVILQLPIIK